MDRRRKTWIWVIGGTLTVHVILIAGLAYNGAFSSKTESDDSITASGSRDGKSSDPTPPSDDSSPFENDTPLVQSAIENARSHANTLTNEEKFAVIEEKGDQLKEIDPKDITAIVGVIEAVSGWSKDETRAQHPRGFEPAPGQFDETNSQYYAVEILENPGSTEKTIRFTLRDREYRTKTIEVLESKLTKPQQTELFKLKRKSVDPDVEKYLNFEFLDVDSVRMYSVAEKADEKTGKRVFIFTHMDKYGRTYEERVLEGRMRQDQRNFYRLSSMRKSNPNLGHMLDAAHGFAAQLDKARREKAKEESKKSAPTPPLPPN